MYALPALLSLLSLTPVTTEGIANCTNEADKGANKAPGNPPCFFYFMFYCFSNSVN